nr:hypothetical protein [Tanacetum cinerariifolium]
MEDTMFELVKICQEKEFLCIHDDINDLIKSTLDSKLLLINSNSQHLEKKEHEVKNVVEQPAEHGNRSIQSLQNFRVVHKSSISFKDTSQISSIHSVAPTQSTKEPEHSLSMGKCEVTLEDEIECDMPAKDDCSPVFTTFSNPLFKDNDDLDSSDDESLPDEDVPVEEFKIYSNPLFDEDEINSDKLDPHYFNVESDFVESLLNRDTFIDFSSKFDFSGELAHIKPEIPKSNFDFEEENCLIENLLYDNSFLRSPEELNAEITDTIIKSIPLLPIPVQDGNSQQEEIDIVTKTDDVLPPSVENDDDLSNDHLLEEVDLFLSDNSIPPSIENFANDPEGDIREEIPVVMNDKDKDVYSSFIFVIYREMFPLLLSAESEDTIFDPANRDFLFQLLSLRTIEYMDRIKLTTRLLSCCCLSVFVILKQDYPQRLKLSCVGIFVRIVLNFIKSAKSRTISTQERKQESKPDQKARFFKNKYTMKLKFVKDPSLRTILALRSKLNPVKCKSQKSRDQLCQFVKVA